MYIPEIRFYQWNIANIEPFYEENTKFPNHKDNSKIRPSLSAYWESALGHEAKHLCIQQLLIAFFCFSYGYFSHISLILRKHLWHIAFLYDIMSCFPHNLTHCKTFNFFTQSLFQIEWFLLISTVFLLRPSSFRSILKLWFWSHNKMWINIKSRDEISSHKTPIMCGTPV